MTWAQHLQLRQKLAGQPKPASSKRDCLSPSFQVGNLRSCVSARSWCWSTRYTTNLGERESANIGCSSPQSSSDSVLFGEDKFSLSLSPSAVDFQVLIHSDLTFRSPAVSDATKFCLLVFSDLISKGFTF
ncbi:hypothetical protein L6164_016138 [Bauhinia variegata]|uniref:Uncharacterized protein n=1 Tax=Bauhinia variegata TaxID=167791 RepID=A0ACB9NND4_BAUVA|nr:hypothetical protein L6164_016138 [Bauhinia variegata]